MELLTLIHGAPVGFDLSNTRWEGEECLGSNGASLARVALLPGKLLELRFYFVLEVVKGRWARACCN